MTEHQADESSRTSDVLRAELVYSFGEYHSPIAMQVALVEQLIDAVRQEERARCAALAERMGREVSPSNVQRLGGDIADAIRQQPESA